MAVDKYYKSDMISIKDIFVSTYQSQALKQSTQGLVIPDFRIDNCSDPCQCDPTCCSSLEMVPQKIELTKH